MYFFFHPGQSRYPRTRYRATDRVGSSTKDRGQLHGKSAQNSRMNRIRKYVLELRKPFRQVPVGIVDF